MKKKVVKKAKRARKVAAPKTNGSKLEVFNIKVRSVDRKALVAQAKRWAKGNLSAWVRYAGLKYTPKRGETIPLSPFPVRK